MQVGKGRPHLPAIFHLCGARAFCQTADDPILCQMSTGRISRLVIPVSLAILDALLDHCP